MQGDRALYIDSRWLGFQRKASIGVLCPFSLGKSTFYGDGVSSHHIMREDTVLGACAFVRVLSSTLDEGGAGQGSDLYRSRRSRRCGEHNAP